jgi:rubredoxin
MQPFTGADLLEVWEHGVGRHPLDRGLLLLAAAKPDTSEHELADVPLGARNAALMALRRANFGERLSCWLDCPECGERMEFELQPEQLPTPAKSLADKADRFDAGGHRFRFPSTRHLARLARTGGSITAMRLLRECADNAATLPVDDAELAELLPAVESEIERGDPWADLAMETVCPDCGHTVQTQFDIAAYLWEEIDARARRLLDEVHLLASRYGWAESAILDMSATRRAHYLSRSQE